MKIIKVIDLLILITDKEELPKKIKVLSNGEIFTYEKEKDDYIGENDDGLFNECILNAISLEIFLNDEVEIIEEDETHYTYKITKNENGTIVDAKGQRYSLIEEPATTNPDIIEGQTTIFDYIGDSNE